MRSWQARGWAQRRGDTDIFGALSEERGVMPLQLPVSGWPSQVARTLWRYVSETINNGDVKHFKIGRSIDVEKRFSEYARQYSADPPDGYVVLYQTKSPTHAKEVQEELLWQFSNHPKCLNDTIHSAGGESTLYVQYVYVLIWIKEGR